MRGSSKRNIQGKKGYSIGQLLTESLKKKILYADMELIKDQRGKNTCFSMEGGEK